LIYLVLWIVTPEKPFTHSSSTNPPSMENQQTHYQEPPRPQEPTPTGNPSPTGQPDHRHRGNLIGGLVLITLGALFLADQLIPRINFGDLWPIILIVVGIGLLVSTMTRNRKTY
jgi:phage shock protein C